MAYTPPWEEQDNDGTIAQDRDRAQDYSWTDLFVGHYGSRVPPLAGDVLWTPNLDSFEFDPDVRIPEDTPPTGGDDEEDLLVPVPDEVGVLYTLPTEESECGDESGDETGIIDIGLHEDLGPGIIDFGLHEDVYVDTVAYFEPERPTDGPTPYAPASDPERPEDSPTPYMTKMGGGSMMGSFDPRSPDDVPKEILNMAMTNNFGDLGVDFLKDTRPISNFGTLSKAPSNGKKERAFSMSFSVPANKKNVTLVSYSYVDLMSVNQRLGTNFSNQRLILGISYNPMVFSGKVHRKASLTQPSLNKKGASTKNAGHKHTYAVDESGNGNTMEACSPDGVCHQHKIIDGEVQVAIGAQGPHKHAISFSKGEATTISDIRIKDFGSLKRIANVNVSPTSLQPEKELNPINQFAISREDDGTLGFIFGLDVTAALKNSALGSVFSKIKSTGIRKEIVSNAIISSMEVVRITKEGKKEVIASSAQKGSAKLLEENIKTNRVRTQEEGKLLGSISEINMGIDDIRTFSGKDLSPLYEDGVTYVVKVEMADAVAIYLKSKLNTLNKAISRAESFSAKVESSKYSDNSRKTFSYNGSRAIKKEFKTRSTPIESALPLLAEIAGDIFGQYSPSEIIDICYPMVNSVTGNSQGIESVISAMKSLSFRMGEIIGDKINLNSLHRVEKTASPGFGTSKNPLIQIEKEYVSDLYKSNEIGTGNVFIKGESGGMGVNIVSKSDYENRIMDEIKTYSDSTKVALPSEIAMDTVISRTKLTRLTNLKSSMSSYLTPASVNIDGEVAIGLSSVGDLFNESATATAVESLNAKKSGQIHTEFLSGKLLSALGITCEIFGSNKSGPNAAGAGTFPVDDDEVGVLPSDNKFSFQNIEEQVDVGSTGPSKEAEEISKSLAPTLTLNLDSSLQGGTDFEDFDLSKDGNILGTLSVSDVDSLPIPLKSLFLSKSKDTKKNWLADEDSSNSFELSCKSIARIEVLSYEKDSNGNMSPKWKTLTASRLKQVGERSLRCRVVNYSNPQLGIENANTPILNSQFVIAGDKISSIRNFAKNSTVERMSKYLLSLNMAVREDLIRVGMSGVKPRK